MNKCTIWNNARIATLDSQAFPMPYGLIENGSIVTQGNTIQWVGPRTDVPSNLIQISGQEHDLQGALVTPGLIDCHNHLVYAGQRANEFEMRLNGASYEEIARSGGGILSTVAATRAASDGELLHLAMKRASSLMEEGVTTLEVKSGYGLSEHDEKRCLTIARLLGTELGLNIRTTFLGAHTLPPEFKNRADGYVDAVCEWMPGLQSLGLVDAVDAFCENIGFTVAQTRKIFEKARYLGLPVKLHAEQLSDQNGAALAAEFGALSCDHLEHLSETGVRAMAKSRTVAVLLPGAYYFLRDTHLPPVDLLRANGVPIAIATDHNPGSSPGLSLLLMLNMACTLFRLTPEEALRGVTQNAALALGLHDRGMIRAGMRADFVAWNLSHPNELSYWFGTNPCSRVVFGGKERKNSHE